MVDKVQWQNQLPNLCKISPGAASTANFHLPHVELFQGSAQPAVASEAASTAGGGADRLAARTASKMAAGLTDRVLSPGNAGQVIPGGSEHFNPASLDASSAMPGAPGHDATGVTAFLSQLLQFLEGLTTATADAAGHVLSADEIGAYVDSLKHLTDA